MFNPAQNYHCRYCAETFRLKLSLWNHLNELHKSELKVDFGKVSGRYSDIMNPSWREK